jgi:hypothetical protein
MESRCADSDIQKSRANVDIIPALLQYISKYVSKAEPKSAVFTDIFNSNPDENSLTSIQKLLLNSIMERDIFAQETCHHLLNIALYHSSRLYESINLNEESPRWLRGKGSREKDAEHTTIYEEDTQHN